MKNNLRILLLWLSVPLIVSIIFPHFHSDESKLNILNNIITFTVLLFSIVVHEVSHGYMAYRNGDMTAKEKGRLTLSPFPHIDPFGSIALPLILHFTGAGFMVGWAKGVPFNPQNLRRFPRDVNAISLAGPMSNFALFFIALLLILLLKAILIHFNSAYSEISVFQHEPLLTTVPTSIGGGLIYVTIKGLSLMILYNAFLGVFNLIPFPPLDGFWIFKHIMPQKMIPFMTGLQRYGFILLIIAVNFKLHTVLLYPAFIMLMGAQVLVGGLF